MYGESCSLCKYGEERTNRAVAPVTGRYDLRHGKLTMILDFNFNLVLEEQKCHFKELFPFTFVVLSILGMVLGFWRVFFFLKKKKHMGV